MISQRLDASSPARTGDPIDAGHSERFSRHLVPRSGTGQLAIRYAPVVEQRAGESLPYQPEGYPCSALLITLPSVITQVLRAVAETIPEEHLTTQGRELYPHITVLDGLQVDRPAGWRTEVEGERPFTVRLGKTSAFLAAQTGLDYDVLKVEIESEALVRLHHRLAGLLPHTCAFPDYVPHATVAFLQPGYGARYTGQRWLAGWAFVVDHLTFSSRLAQTEELWLQGQLRSAGAPRESRSDDAGAR